MYLTLNEAFEKAGLLGKWQIIFIIALSLYSIPSSWTWSAGIVFQAGVPDHWCANYELAHRGNLSRDQIKRISIPTEVKFDGSAGYNKCMQYDRNYSAFSDEELIKWNVTLRTEWATAMNVSERVVKCKSWEYDKSVFTVTTVSQFNLVCDDDWKLAFSSSAFMAGMFLGAISAGAFSDKFGRYKTCIICLLLQMVVSFALAFPPNYIVWVVLRFLFGFTGLGFFTALFVLNTEMIHQKYRVKWFSISGFIYIGGYLMIPGIAFLLKDYHWQQLAMSVPLIPFVLCIWYLPESPRWLLTQGRQKEALKILKSIGRINKKELPDNVVIQMNDVTPSANVIDLFRTPGLRKRTFNVYYQWFINVTVYYGLTLNMGSLPGNIYLNFFLSGLGEIPAKFIMLLTLDRFGRKRPLAVAELLAGLCLLGCLPVIYRSDLSAVRTALALIGRVFISASFGMVYMFTAELYPTVCRNVAIGSASTLGRIGAVLAPQLSLLDKYWAGLSTLVFGVMAILAALLVLLLPDTLDTALPESIEESEHFGKKKMGRELKFKPNADLCDYDKNKDKPEMEKFISTA